MPALASAKARTLVLYLVTASVIATGLAGCLCSTRVHAQGNTARFSNGFPSDPSFLPIGVWLQNPHDAQAYKGMGVNTFVGLWEGPTENQLVELAKAGVFAIASQNDVALNSPSGHVIKAWMQDDEPDNAQPLPGGGYGDCVLPNQVLAKAFAIRSRDSTRPIFLNFGQGVANKYWHGRGSLCDSMNHDTYYRQASRGADILSSDIYPVTEFRQPRVHGRLEFVAYGVGNLMRWVTPDQRVWAIIGTTHVSAPKQRPTPSEIRAMTWLALISGARGLVYFVHEWQPTFGSNAIFRYPEIVASVTQLNAELMKLAAAINSPNVVEVTVNPDNLAVMARVHDDTLYVFAGNLSRRPVHALINIASGLSRTGIPIGESRPATIRHGVLSDDFAPYDIHLYAFPLK